MKKIGLRCLLTVVLLVCLRLVYVTIYRVPFFEQVFITTSIGLIIGITLAEVILSKSKVR